VKDIWPTAFVTVDWGDDALRDFGTLPTLDIKRFERWRSVQKSCWINRFYWIVPLAKRAA
jgi:hypothetical protein